jgi:hypothetical protein
MAFTPNMREAARRHLQAADLLSSGHRCDVAGYLYGIAAECALKAMMIEMGMRPRETRSKDDPFFVHFPTLRTMLRDRELGRLGQQITRLVQSDSFMNNWDIDMRYSPGQIQPSWVDEWARQAKRAVELLNGL